MDNGQEQATLVIGNYNYSSWSFRAWLFLRAFGLPFTTVRIPLMQAGTKKAILDHSGAGKVPVLKYDGMTIWDSLAICETVNEQVLAGKGWPKDARLRALGRSVAAEMHSGFAALRNHLPMNVRRRYAKISWPAEAQQDIDRIQELFAYCLKQSGGPYLLGGLSMADCCFAPVISRFHTYNVGYAADELRSYATLILQLPQVQEWYALAAAEQETIGEIEFSEED